MKRILYLSPHSFPIHSSESICNVKIAYILAEIGYIVDVLSFNDGNIYPDIYNADNIFIKNKNINSYILNDSNKNNSHLESRIIHLKALFKTKYFYKGINYSYLAIKESEKLIKKYGHENYKAIISRGYRTEVAAIYLKKKYKIPWIANWNDPYPIEKFPPPYGHGIDAKLSWNMNRILSDIPKYADKHTFPCIRLRDYMLKYLNINKENTVIIPHAAHSILSDNENKKISSTLYMIHAGNVNFPRNPENFLIAYSKFIHSSLLPKVMCIFLGNVNKNFNDIIYKLDIQNFIKYIPPQNYYETLNYIKNSNLSIIIEAICDEGIYLPTKVVDSLQCNTPIFCISPNIGTLHDLINDNKIGYYANNESINDIYNSLNKIYNDFLEKKLPVISKTNTPYFFEDSIKNQYKNILK